MKVHTLVSYMALHQASTGFQAWDSCGVLNRACDIDDIVTQFIRRKAVGVTFDRCVRGRREGETLERQPARVLKNKE